MMRSVRAAALAGLLTIAGCSHVQSLALPVVAEISGSIDGATLVAAPPAGGAAAADTVALHGPWTEERIAQARADDRFDAFSAFAPVLGPGFNAEAYPLTNRVFERLFPALGAAIGVAKDRYARPRPFVADPSLPTCVDPTERLRASGSYPSGHAAFGWAWGLILAELDPSRADALLQRGREYGQSRVVCGVHYPSDVEAGRVIGAGALARLHADASFRRDLDAARQEWAAGR